jgi:predicted GIY-YIG superfamily endonuclease
MTYFLNMSNILSKSVSRLLGANAEIAGTRAISTPEIREIQTGKYYVYVILCENNSLYIGQTNNLQTRWKQHRQGKGALWTKNHTPIKIVHLEEFDTIKEAVKREKDLKTGFGRKWLKKLVASKLKKHPIIETRLPAASSAAQAGAIYTPEIRDIGTKITP